LSGIVTMVFQDQPDYDFCKEH